MPGTDSTRFALAGKVLGKFREVKPRSKPLWNDAYENPQFPGSLAKADLRKVHPNVHQSVIDRMKRDPIQNADGNTPAETAKYRPELFECYDLPQSPDGNRNVIFTKLREDIRIVPITD